MHRQIALPKAIKPSSSKAILGSNKAKLFSMYQKQINATPRTRKPIMNSEKHIKNSSGLATPHMESVESNNVSPFHAPVLKEDINLRLSAKKDNSGQKREWSGSPKKLLGAHTQVTLRHEPAVE